MTKILKSGKKALSFVVAFAVIAVSLFVAVPAINLTASAAVAATDTWDGTQSEPKTTDSSGNVIINNAEELAWVALSGNAVAGTTYKVAAGQVFNMNGRNGITPTSTAAQVQAATVVTNTWTAANAFKGNFDGNGLIVYNLNCQTGNDGHTALFPYVKYDTSTHASSSTPYNQTIANVKVIASYFSNYHSNAGIVGKFSTRQHEYLTVSGCEVANCYMGITASGAGNRNAAAFIGNTGNATSSIENCYAHGNTLEGLNGNFAFIASQGSFAVGKITITNVIVTDNVSTTIGANTSTVEYNNVYTAVETNTTGVITPATMNGKALNGLDYDTVWLANAGVPELRVFHTLKATNNGDTHSEVCTRCDLAGFEAAHNYVADYEKGESTCSCGIKVNNILDTWDGSQTKPTTKDGDTFIIKTAEELAWVALSGQTAGGESYKVVPNALFDLNGMTGITADSTLAQVQAAAKTGKYWIAAGDANTNGFKGASFDGNGLIVYNANSAAAGANGQGSGGLFPWVKNDATINNTEVTIKNVKVVASYFSGYHYAGGIIGEVHFHNTSTKLTMDNIEVSNTVVHTQTHNQRAGAVIGQGQHAQITLKNAYVHDSAVEGAKISSGTVACLSGFGTFNAESSIIMGISPVAIATAGNEGGLGNMAVADKVTFTNVYTDNATVTTGVTQVTAWAGQELKEGLNPTVWFANTTKEPVLKLFHNIKGTSNGASGHTATCADCGLAAIAAEDHDWSANNGVCPVCGYGCEHANATEGDVVNAGNCTTDREVKMVCECGAAPNKITSAPGHTLGSEIAAQDGDCGNDGWVAHYKCSVCDGYTLTNDAMADTVDYDTEIKIAATGNHTPKMVGGEYVYDMNLEGYHRFICATCETPFGDEAHNGTLIPDSVDPARGHTGSCTACGFGTNGVAPHTFGNDTICDGCQWVCEDHAWDNGVLKTIKDCVTDETTEFTCTICNHKETRTTNATQGHTFEHKTKIDAKCNEDGTMAHEYCTTCNKKYADGANVKTPFENAVLDADLVITERPACTTTHKEEIPAQCKQTGTKAHELCTTCGKIYLTLTDVANGNNVDASALVIDEKGHSYDEYDAADKPIYKYDDAAHWYVCTICGIVEKADHKLDIDTASYEGTYTVCEDGCGFETFIHQQSSADGIVSIEATNGTFSKDVWTKITDIVDEDFEYSALKLILKGADVETFIMYDISSDETMAEGGSATITFKVPESYGNNLAIYYIDQINQTTEKLETAVTGTGDERVATATTDHFSVFALAELSEVDDGGNGGSGDIDDGGNGGNDYDYNGGSSSEDVNGDSSNQSPATASQNVIIALVAAALLAGVALIIFRKVKKA